MLLPVAVSQYPLNKMLSLLEMTVLCWYLFGTHL